MRWLVPVFVMVACATVWADPAAISTAQTTAATAQKQVDAAAKKLVDLQQKKADELRAIDRLKTERPSWSRDRELRSALSDASDLVPQLERATKEVAAAQGALAGARTTLLSAIDAEIAAGPLPPRAQELVALRAQIEPVRQAPRKIVIPNCDADPNADLEDLDVCARALHDDEVQLGKQVVELDRQTADLQQNAELRKHSKRANELANRDNDDPSRSTPRSNGGTLFTATVGGSDGAPATPSNTDHGTTGLAQFSDNRAFETEAIVLADVVDRATIDGLNRAQLSSDPAQRAIAAQKTRDAVKERLKRLSVQREAIEKRAKQLRGHSLGLPIVDDADRDELAMKGEIHRIARDVTPRGGA